MSQSLQELVPQVFKQESAEANRPVVGHEQKYAENHSNPYADIEMVPAPADRTETDGET